MTKVEHLDLKDITRPGARCTISIGKNQSRVKWITCGLLDISSPDDYGRRTVAARMGRGATDVEEDSAWAFSFDVIALEFESMWNGDASYKAYIAIPHSDWDYDSFKVPLPGHDPFEGSETCTRCSEPHPIVQKYVPDSNIELYKRLAGQYVYITVNPHEEG